MTVFETMLEIKTPENI